MLLKPALSPPAAAGRIRFPRSVRYSSTTDLPVPSPGTCRPVLSGPADLFKKIRQFFEKCSVIFYRSVISPQRAVENSRFYQILEHMASVAELRHIL